MDSDSDDDLIASLVGSGMKGGAKAVGDDFVRFQEGREGENRLAGRKCGSRIRHHRPRHRPR
jgi:hypothetical protein